MANTILPVRDKMSTTLKPTHGNTVFLCLHDIETHIELSGGDSAYIKRLDALFDAPAETRGWKSADVTGLIGMYAHGNEPSHHVAYLYNYAGKPASAQKRVREIMSTLYSSDPSGLCGNEDCGRCPHGMS
jgi:Putative alpha-1,2-mannosidase